MARPLKKGLDYFPLDVNIDSDDKLKILEGLYGIVGFGVVIKVLMKIYDNGFYYEWQEIEPILMAERTKVDVETTKNIIKDSVKYGLFNEKLFNNYQILTSIGIQKRYFNACGKRKKGEAEREYLLLSEEEVMNLCPKIALISIIQGKTEDNQGITRVNQKSSTQSKVNKSKVNKSKVNNNIYDDVFNHWNIKSNLTKIKNLSNTRKSSINARIEEFDLETVYKVIEITNDSDFLSGKATDFKAGFDWVFKPTNFLKILEGNYNNKPKKEITPNFFNDIGGGGNGKYKQTIIFPDEK